MKLRQVRPLERFRRLVSPGNLRGRLLAASALTAAFALALPTASAFAERVYQSQISEANGSAFSNPMGLAVDEAGNLWVSDAHAGGTVYEFNSSGAFQAFTASPPWSGEYIESLAFSAKAQKVFVSDSGADDLWGLASNGSYTGPDINAGLGSGCCYIRVAADNSGGATDGDLYVSKQSSVVRVEGSGAAANFSGSAAYINQNSLTGPFTSAGALAVGPNGALYVASGHKLVKFEPSGEFTGLEITEAESGEPLGSIGAVAVDPVSENVLVSDTGHGVIDEFDSEGEYLGQIGQANGAPLGQILGLAVSPTGTLYAADSSKHLIDVFGPAPVLPKLIYEQPGIAEHGSITLHATVNPKTGGEIEECEFEYGLTSQYGAIAPCDQATPLSETTAVSATLTGLTAGMTYHYRLVIANGTTTKVGGDHTFFSGQPDLPEIGDTDVTEVTTQGAVLGAEINPGFGTTVYRFQYGPTAAYGSRTYPEELTTGDNGFHAVAVTLTELTPNTTYHFRVVAVNWSGTTYGSDKTFATLPQVPVSTSVENVPPSATSPSTPPEPVMTPRCKHGFVKRHGTCVKRQAKKKRHGKHHKRRGGNV